MDLERLTAQQELLKLRTSLQTPPPHQKSPVHLSNRILAEQAADIASLSKSISARAMTEEQDVTDEPSHSPEISPNKVTKAYQSALPSSNLNRPESPSQPLLPEPFSFLYETPQPTSILSVPLQENPEQESLAAP